MPTLFLVQNDTHAKNFNLLAKELVSKGEAVSILLLDKITLEETAHFFSEDLKKLINYTEKSETPFYRSTMLRRIVVCFGARAWAKKNIGLYDHVVIGNDGALQKIIIRAARNRNCNCRVTMMLDGLLTREAGVRGKIKRYTQRLAGLLGIDDLVPSTVGLSRYIDDITVMHTSVAEVLAFHGVERDLIKVSTLPRHELVRNAAKRSTDARLHVLFLGGAYLWHGEKEGHQRQVSDFERFIEFSNESSNVVCRLRMHPRDDIDEYHRLNLNAVEVSGKHVALESDLEWADVVVASRSSGLFDAVLAGRRVFVYTAHFGKPIDDSFLRSLPKVTNFAEICE
jgi:hypothetical protein